jgi:hypothetical protein
MPTIYAIFDPNQMIYVGCTAGKYEKRLREHRCLLRANKHKCAALQASWNSCGGQGFWARSLEECKPEKRRERELHWMKHFKNCGQLFNEHLISFRPPFDAPAKAAAQRVANGYKPSAESNEKRRSAQFGKPKGHGAKISATKRAKAMR